MITTGQLQNSDALGIASLLSSIESQMQFLQSMPIDQRHSMAPLLRMNNRDKDALRKRDERSESARIVIPECVNPVRREKCLADPERFMRVYFADRYPLPFGRDHRFMIEAFVECAQHRRWQALAAPRGRGKSEIVKGVVPYVVLRGLVRFPLAVAATTKLGSRLFKDFKKKFRNNRLLLEDFPEVCFPIRALDGAPQRAPRQHVNGQLTNIVWDSEYVRFPDVPGSSYGGIKMAFYGLDAAFRGANIDGDRPDFVIVDDPETRESAKSIPQIEDREAIIEQDIVGLKSQDHNIAIVVLTTCQNRYSLSYRLTDPKTKPAFNGKRFGMVLTWPTNMEKWDTYIAMRHADQEAGDPCGMNAVAFYLANRDAMDAGATMLSDHFVPVETNDGRQAVYSAIQQAFNQIANTSMEAYRTEYQNDPPAEEAIETVGVTAAKVQSRLSTYKQREVASTTELRTMAIDLGDRNSHWVSIGWEGAAIGSIDDYGIMETHLATGADDKAIELALLASLEVWADEVVAAVNPLLVLVDSGSGKAHQPAVYEFCRRRGAPFFPSKGWASSRFRLPDRQQGKEPFLEAWAHEKPDDGIWLYNINTEYWKKWVWQRFLTAPYDAACQRTDGSLVLFNPGEDRKRHLSFAHHITAEEEQLVPVYGKEMKRTWFVKNRNNHWLDATALACAAAGCVGIRLVKETQQEPEQPIQEPAPTEFLDQWGRPFLASGR